jgi:hypothetical protein
MNSRAQAAIGSASMMPSIAALRLWLRRRAWNRLLVIPLLLAQFRRSEHGAWVLYGFLASAVTLLFVCWVLVLDTQQPRRRKRYVSALTGRYQIGRGLRLRT